MISGGVWHPFCYSYCCQCSQTASAQVISTEGAAHLPVGGAPSQAAMSEHLQTYPERILLIEPRHQPDKCRLDSQHKPDKRPELQKLLFLAFTLHIDLDRSTAVSGTGRAHSRTDCLLPSLTHFHCYSSRPPRLTPGFFYELLFGSRSLQTHSADQGFARLM